MIVIHARNYYTSLVFSSWVGAILWTIACVFVAATRCCSTENAFQPHQRWRRKTITWYSTLCSTRDLVQSSFRLAYISPADVRSSFVQLSIEQRSITRMTLGGYILWYRLWIIVHYSRAEFRFDLMGLREVLTSLWNAVWNAVNIVCCCTWDSTSAQHFTC